MRKKIKKKKTKDGLGQDNGPKHIAVVNDEKPFVFFGRLPERNLKKNLGC